MPYYVHKLLNDGEDNYNENYENIINYYNETKIKYRPESFDEINSIFKKVTAIEEWVDTSKYLAYVLESGDTISIGDYNKNIDNKIKMIGFNFNNQYFYLDRYIKPAEMGLKGAMRYFCNTLPNRICFKLDAVLPSIEELEFLNEYQDLVNHILQWKLSAWFLDVKNGKWISCDMIPGKRLIYILKFGQKETSETIFLRGYCLPVFIEHK